MSSDLDYLQNYLPGKLYVHPGRNGAYATLVSENEVLLGEIEVTDRSRLAVSAFFVNEKNDYGTLKITKLAYHNRNGWREVGHVQINHFEREDLKSFVSILSSIDLRDSKKTRIALDDIQIDALSTLLSSSRGKALVRELSDAPALHDDIYAVATKRRSLGDFANNLSANLGEPEWQSFFEDNTWIFGHGLQYVFLDKVAKKLEAATTGAAFDQLGKRADGLMRPRAEVSQYVLVEIKRNDTELLQSSDYRPGCWAVSHELASAVTQVQKTVFEFTRNRFRDRLKNKFGTDFGPDVYAIEPKSYLIIGNLGQVLANDDKVTCFELFRRNVRAPEILTFDELFHRASCIVENISHKAEEKSLTDKG